MKKLKVKISEIVEAMESNSYEISYYLDTQTGEIIPVSSMFEDENEDQEKYDFDDRYLLIPGISSHKAYNLMVEFTETVPDPQLKKFLFIALDGKGAFRRFKDILAEYLEERNRWFDFEYSKIEKLAREWLREKGIEPFTPISEADS